MRKGLGIDVGASRIGLSIGTMAAQELETIVFTSLDAVVSTIISVAKREGADYIVVGVPQSRAVSNSKDKAVLVAKQLKQKFNEVILVDETLTTARAEELLKEEGASIGEVKARSDQAAARLILQQYIDEAHE